MDDALMGAQAALNAIGAKDVPGDSSNPTRQRLRGIIQSITRANELSRGDGDIVGDTAVAADVTRDMMQMVNEERQFQREEQETEEDVDFLSKIHDGGYPEVAKLIGFTAEFADEDAHGLISPNAKAQMNVNGGMFPKKGHTWDFFVSDKLEAHCREVTEIIRVRHRHRLGDVETKDIVKWVDKDSKAILTAYCRCVATRWRTSSIIAGQQYKSTKMIDTIKQAFLEHLSFFAGVTATTHGRLSIAKPTQYAPVTWGSGLVIDA